MSKLRLKKIFNEYINYCKDVRGLNNPRHWNGLKDYLIKNYREINAVTWCDLAGGFTSFLIDNGNTLSIGNELFDGENNAIEYSINLEQYQSIENTNFDMDLIPQIYLRIWKGGNL